MVWRSFSAIAATTPVRNPAQASGRSTPTPHGCGRRRRGKTCVREAWTLLTVETVEDGRGGA